MTVGAWILLAILVLAGGVYMLAPVRGRSEPFPEDPRPEELREELNLLKNEARELVGAERRRLLARIAHLERTLQEFAPAPSTTRRPAAWVYGLAVLGVVVVGAVLWRYTLPRLPGETVTTAIRVEDALRLQELRQEAESANTAQSWLRYADFAWEVGDFTRAAEGYAAVLRLNPREPRALERMGKLLFISGRFDLAANVLVLATQLDPNEPEGWLFLGSAYYQLAQMKEAVQAWERYLALDAGDANQVAPLIEKARSLADAPLGQRVYAVSCAACHGADGQGGTGPRLKGNPVVEVSDAVRGIITQGMGAMPAIPLDEERLEALLEYLKNL
ncbi:c-type cytochrome [Marinithermus hydrothermalis]|uniref:Cytochrome c class I n=1 Tax=Marinithermus hydrothermalis (strain DSM 14884 / JCM 11576 / T1) TaxID=869210 RepID=F2NMW2_MARHT|nr:c-type cytochrome [Marinithermus hydrothermalis]AEB12701.1 cytochrome c class I [Marinithermus hydrothermalis DSM 14884]